MRDVQRHGTSHDPEGTFGGRSVRKEAVAHHVVRRGAVAAPVLAVQAAIGALLAAGSSMAVLVASGAAALVMVVLAPAVVMSMTLPASFAFWRLGPGELSLSLTDVCLGAGIIAALPYVPFRSPQLRSLLRLVGVYLAILLLAVAAEPSARAAFEFLHRAFLAGGCVVVGAAIVGMGKARMALGLFVAVSSVVASAAVVESLQQGLAPAYPFGMHKNAAGTLIATAVLVSFVAAPLLRLPAMVRTAVDVVLFGGVLACQSRGAVLTLAVVLALLPVLRTHPDQRHTRRRDSRQKLVLVVGVAAGLVMTAATANALFTRDGADDRFNSLNSRTLTYEAAIDLWQEKPITGQGLKYWREPALQARTVFGEPHNLVVSALAESGVVGLGGLVLLIVGSLRIVSRNREPLGRLGLLALISHPMGALLGIYWVAGTFSLPWLLAGMAVGAGVAAAKESDVVTTVGRA